MPKYKRCLCVKYNGKWKEVVYYRATKGEVQFVESYGVGGVYLSLRTMKVWDYDRFKMKWIKVKK